MNDNRMRIIVLGYIIRGPMGGMIWNHLQYVMGLAQLGHDVYFVEDSGDYPSCYNPITWQTNCDPTCASRHHRRDRVFIAKAKPV